MRTSPRSSAARPWTVLLVAALALAGTGLPGVAGQPGDAEAVPEDLPGQAAEVTAGLDDVGQAEDLATARGALAQVLPNASVLVDPATDLAARDGELLGTYLAEMERAGEAGNLSDLRSLARAASGLLEDELQPAFQAWQTNRTAVLIGPAEAAGEARARLPVVLVHPPPGGIGAFDLVVEVRGPATPVGATLATGQGEAVADPGNGTARLASFEAKALSGLQAHHPRVLLGQLTVEGNGTIEVDVEIREVVDGQGGNVPTLGLVSTHDLATAATGSPGPSAVLVWGGLGLGVVLVLVAAHRWLEV